MTAVFGVCGSEIPSGLELVDSKDIEEQNVVQKLIYDFRTSGILFRPPENHNLRSGYTIRDRNARR